MIVTDPAFVRAWQYVTLRERNTRAYLRGEPVTVWVHRDDDYIIYYESEIPNLWRYLRIRDLMAGGMSRKSALQKSRREWKHEPWLLNAPTP